MQAKPGFFSAALMVGALLAPALSAHGADNFITVGTGAMVGSTIR